MATPFTDMYEHVLPELPGCPTVLVLPTIVKVVRHFCEQTQAWKLDLDAINIRSGVDTYDLDGVPSCAEIIMPSYVESLGNELDAEDGYTMPNREQITLSDEPQEDEVGGLVIQVVLRPKTDATETCDDLFCDWHEIWAYGVMERLMRMPDKIWTEPNMANAYHTMYWNGINDARVDVDRGHTNRLLIARPKNDWLGD